MVENKVIKSVRILKEGKPGWSSVTEEILKYDKFWLCLLMGTIPLLFISYKEKNKGKCTI